MTTAQRPTMMWTQDPDQIGEFLRQVRIAKGLRQADVAQALTATTSFVSNVEAGRRMPSNPMLMLWIKYLDVVFMMKVREDNE